MAVIRIKDLPESQELDRNAMRTIMGGARSNVRRPMGRSARPGGGTGATGATGATGTRIVDFPGSEFLAPQVPAGKPVKSAK